jgi:sigma-B regulation protein RsbU (phosphoserine phosphatase)
MWWSYLFFALFLASLIALLVVVNAFTRKVAESERARTEMEVEETRVFDFLHGLGEAFSEGVRSSQLHRLIVEGAVRILESHGGCLYLVDKNDTTLVPAFISKGCPPLVDVPPHIREQAASTPVALESFLRLHSLKRGEGLLGSVWKSGEARLLGEEDFSDDTIPADDAHSALIAPLHYRRKILGILAVANAGMSQPFNDEDLGLFKMIAEQSAFALYNEAVYLEAGEKKRLDQDLQIAREIQSILLPSAAPDLPGYEIAGTNIPARRVSGDYYDYLPIDENRLGVVIADVSGKGIPASLIMAMARSVIRSQAGSSVSPSEVLRRVNRQLYPDIKEDMFISMAYLVLNRENGEVVIARAGHDAPFKYCGDTTAVEEIKPRGMALGIDSGDVFDRVCEDFSFHLRADDCLLLYTDGATEALDDNGLEFGVARVTQSLQAAAPHGAPAVVHRLAEDLKDFVGNSPQYDDITLIAIRKT